MSILPFHRRRTPHTVFVLGGGGNLGAVQVGMLKAVLQRGIVPDILLGCSVGAINAAAIAGQPDMDGIALLEDVWSSLPRDAMGAKGRLSSVRALAHRGMAMGTNEPLRRMIEDRILFSTFEEATVPMQVVATSLRTGRERWFTHGPVLDPILASAALPGVLPPVAIDDDLFIDGGVVDNVPVRRALSLHPKRVVVFHVGNFSRTRPDPRRPIEVMMQAFSIARNHRFLDEATEATDGVELIVLPGVDPGPLRYNDFGRSRQLVQLGHDATANYLTERRPA